MTFEASYKRQVKLWFIILVILIFWQPLPIKSQEHDLNGLFIWAKKRFMQGDYRNTIENLNFILPFLNTSQKDNELKAKIYLLLGATYERRMIIDKARSCYFMAKQIKKNPEIKNIDLSPLIEYQWIILNKKNLTKSQTKKKIDKKREKN